MLWASCRSREVFEEKIWKKKSIQWYGNPYSPYVICTIQFVKSYPYNTYFQLQVGTKIEATGDSFQGLLGWRDKLYSIVLFCLQMYFSWTWKINKFEELSNRFSPEKIEGVLLGSKLTKNLCIFMCCWSVYVYIYFQHVLTIPCVLIWKFHFQNSICWMYVYGKEHLTECEW